MSNLVYQHTQIGYLIIYITIAIVAYFSYISVIAGFKIIIAIFMVLIVMILASFTSLKVTLNQQYLKIKFGYGLYQKKIVVREIKFVQIVKNHWYYGWGIRYWLWPKMTIFNISGFEAVEIKMRDGRIYRIGTDQPQKLAYAIKMQLQKINQVRF